MSRPTLVVVHGSWHSPKHWEPIAQDLGEHGYKCVLVALPSTQSPEAPPANLTDDTNAIRTAVVSELDSGNDVVVVAHSYGGCPANNALEKLDSKTRGIGNSNVRSIIFIAAAVLPVGITFLQALGGSPHPIHDLRTPEFCWVGPPGPEWYFYNEKDAAEAKRAADELRPQSWAAYLEPTSYAAYKDFKCYYLRTTRDNALTFEMQAAILSGLEGDGAVVEVKTIDSDHTPFLGKHLKETSEYIRGVVG